jgi:hypothetical protein
MPRKKPEELKSSSSTETTSTTTTTTTSTAAPQTTESASISVEMKPTVTAQVDQSVMDSADINKDGVISQEEYEMELEFRRKALEDADAMRDAQRNMAWFSLFGMLLYPFAVVLAVLLNLDQAASVLGSMAATYFVSVAAIVMAFFGAQAYTGKGVKKK